MSNNLEINDSAAKCPEPANQLSQECWNFDKGFTPKQTAGTADGVLDFGKNDPFKPAAGGESIADSGSGKVTTFPKGYDIDPGFAPKAGDTHIKIGNEDIVIPAGTDLDPGFAPKAGDHHINIDGKDFVIPAGTDMDPGFNPGGKDKMPIGGNDKGGLLPNGGDKGALLPNGGDKGALLPSAADGTRPEGLDPMTVEGADGFKLKSDAGPKKPSEEELKSAEKKVDAKVSENHEQLPADQQDVRKRLDHAILEGNKKEVEDIMRGYADKPQALKDIMTAVNHDLAPAGVHVGFNVGNMAIGDDKEFHPVGMLNVSRDGAPTDVEFSTDQRIKTTVGNRGLAMVADPGEVFQEIGNYGVEKLNQ